MWETSVLLLAGNHARSAGSMIITDSIDSIITDSNDSSQPHASGCFADTKPGR